MAILWGSFGKIGLLLRLIHTRRSSLRIPQWTVHFCTEPGKFLSLSWGCLLRNPHLCEPLIQHPVTPARAQVPTWMDVFYLQPAANWSHLLRRVRWWPASRSWTARTWCGTGERGRTRTWSGLAGSFASCPRCRSERCWRDVTIVHIWY